MLAYFHCVHSAQEIDAISSRHLLLHITCLGPVQQCIAVPKVSDKLRFSKWPAIDTKPFSNFYQVWGAKKGKRRIQNNCITVHSNTQVKKTEQTCSGLTCRTQSLDRVLSECSPTQQTLSPTVKEYINSQEEESESYLAPSPSYVDSIQLVQILHLNNISEKQVNLSRQHMHGKTQAPPTVGADLQASSAEVIGHCSKSHRPSVPSILSQPPDLLQNGRVRL